MGVAVACGSAVAILLAVLFFGIFAKDDKASEADFANVSEVESAYKKYMKKNGESAVIYVAVSYETLCANADGCDKNSARSYIERKIEKFCRSGAAAAGVDGSSFVISCDLNEKDVAEFCKNILSECSEIANMSEVSIGGYKAEGKTLFKKAAGYAKKAARYAKNNKTGYKLCAKNGLCEIIESENIEKNLEDFINDDKFYLMFQPFVNAKTKQIAGYEAFTRLLDDNKKEVLPNGFLDAIGREKLWHKFDLYTFEKCCKWVSMQQKNDMIISCNFSKVTLESKNIAKELSDIVKKTGADINRVIIEIIDNADSGSFNISKQSTALLKKEGFKICLDDFGSGNAAIKDLSFLKPDYIRIDKNLLYNAKDEQGKALFKSITALAKQTGAAVLCEGIETKSQAELALDAGGDFLQGFYFYKPMKKGDLEEVLKK